MLDEVVVRALRKAVRDAGQSEDLANRLEKWLRALSEGAETLGRTDDCLRRLDTVREAVTLPDEGGAN